MNKVLGAHLHCIISRFYLKCFTCAFEPQQYPRSSSSFEMLLFNLESKIETLESERFISPHRATGLHFKPEPDCFWRSRNDDWVLSSEIIQCACVTLEQTRAAHYIQTTTFLFSLLTSSLFFCPLLAFI